MDPPQCVQNAMMTKDKKPFTYTPGGIDLSEVKSPRMQRRIERNANLGGAGDMPQPPQPPPHVGPLPPSALAAMRPQTQVQVFPGPPPPPPMSKNIPPPPPPPSGPLPTQKVTTGDNQVIERPDMTKIIPENPMALLRKTGGPAPRKSVVDQMFEEQVRAPPAPPQRNIEAQSPRPNAAAPVSPPIQQQRQPQPQQYHPPTPPQNQQHPAYYQLPQQQYQPPQPQYQSSQLQFQPPQPQYQPTQPQYHPPQPQYQQPPPPQPAQYQQPQQQQQRFTDSPKPAFHPPIIERQPAQPKQEPVQRNVSSNVGSLYIPPLAQQQKVASPPTPPERQTQSPGTPTLKEAPRPWQQRTVQQEIPPWAKKDEVVEPVQTIPAPPNRQNRWQPQGSPVPQQPQQQAPTSPQARQQFQPASRPQVQQQSPRSPPTQNQNAFPVHIEIRTVGYQPEVQPSDRNPNAVYVTQPIVLQHPGNRVEPPYKGPAQQAPQQQFQQVRQPIQQQQPKVDSSGARIIPIQIEGRTTPSVPAGDNRNFNRQLSWGTQPSQSNSFKVIQKITKTDDEDDDTPITQHSARYPQEMPEQMRRMKINDNGQFKQGNGQAQPYVHPSEQVVPEPKKYMGSNIPSRSFKILQAMTAPSDSSANANYNEEQPTTYNPPIYPYTYPYYPPPYWPEYYSNYYPPEQPDQHKNNNITEPASTRSGRQTPLPPVPPVYYRPPDYSESSKANGKSGRSTPMPVPIPPPYWGYAPPPPPAYVPPRSTTPKPDTGKANGDENYHYSMYPHPPFYDPYYYPPYYYGYPPMGPPYPYFAPSLSENDEYGGYSSTDEMSSYNSKRSSLQRRNSLENESNTVQALKEHFEVRSKSAAPRITITPTYSQENISYEVLPDEQDINEVQKEVKPENKNNLYPESKLRSIKSVQNLNVYSASDELEEDTVSDSEESSEEETDEEVSVEEHTEEIIPHQLSVIFEESERGESRRSYRCSSVASETTTITEHNSEEENEEDFLSSQNVKYKIKLFQETHESFAVTSSGADGRTIRLCEEQNELFTLQTSGYNDIVEVDDKTDQINENNTLKEAIEDFTGAEDTVIKQSSNEDSNEDWWGVIRENQETRQDKTISQPKIEDMSSLSIMNTQPRVRKSETEPNSVMVDIGDEVVCVKLRNKSHSRTENNNAQIDTLKQNAKETPVDKTDHNIFFSSVPQRNSIYDILKNDDNKEESEEIISGGTLMRVDSFASQLEAIKRNSGLFTLESIKATNVIKEESPDIEEAVDVVDVIESETVSKTEELANETSVAASSESSEEVDFWSQIKTDDDDFTPRRKTFYLDEDNNEPVATNEDSADSSSSSPSMSQENATEIVNETENNASSKDDSDSSDDEQLPENCPLESMSIKTRSSNSRSRSLEPQTIKERIEALRNSIAKKQQKVVNNEVEEQQRNRTCVSSMEVPTTENRSKTASTKSSLKSFEGYSEEEEELDSGVISDISRHISDSEEFPELRKMTRYERAATHSRLFKLLQDQDECDTEEENEEVFVAKEDKFSKLSVRRNRAENHVTHSRSKLSLPLNTYTAEGPPVNQKLVEELVQSLLKSKKAQAFRNMPKEKLYAAAVKILQEGVESGETPSEEFSSLLSPLRGDTQSSTPAQTPQEFYGDSTEYRQYYETWSEAAIEIMPSKAFKLLSEHIEANKLGSIEGILAKCPRILSSKNIPKEIMKLLDESDFDCSRSTSSQNPPNSNDITNT